MSTALREVPEFDASACVRRRVRGSSCAECALACPAGAIMPSADGIVLDPAECTGCGQCQGVCPSQALGTVTLPPSDGQALALICSKARGSATIGCAHALGLQELATLWQGGTRDIAVATAECAACEDAPEAKLSTRVASFNQLLAARELEPMRLRRATKAERETEAAPEHPSRRRLLARAASIAAPAQDAPRPLGQLQAGQDTAEMAFAPVIDAANCTGCHACARICPEGALTVIKAQGDHLWYVSHAEHCTNCALCVDACDADAIGVHPFSPTAAPLELVSFRCRICGVDGAEPRQSGPAPDTCRICRTAPHARALHQVMH